MNSLSSRLTGVPVSHRMKVELGEYGLPFKLSLLGASRWFWWLCTSWHVYNKFLHDVTIVHLHSTGADFHVWEKFLACASAWNEFELFRLWFIGPVSRLKVVLQVIISKQ